MQLATCRHECRSTRETWSLHPLTDLHIDDSDHAHHDLKARIKEIKDDPRALWHGGGDYASLILPEDKRFATHPRADVHRIPDWYVQTVTDLLAPIADKCVGFGIGNHEDTVMRRYHRGVGAEIANNLGVADRYLGIRGWSINQFTMNSRMLTLNTYWWHGWSAGRLRGRKALQAERDIGAWNADVLLLGHDHQPYADIYWTEEVYQTRNGHKIRQRPRVIMNGGSWTYGQREPFPAEKMKPQDIPNEKWTEGKNFRPQGAPSNPYLLLHLDFGNSKNDKTNAKGRPSGIGFEIRQYAQVHHVGGFAA